MAGNFERVSLSDPSFFTDPKYRYALGDELKAANSPAGQAWAAMGSARYGAGYDPKIGHADTYQKLINGYTTQRTDPASFSMLMVRPCHAILRLG
jgi:hypothetical protein